MLKHVRPMEQYRNNLPRKLGRRFSQLQHFLAIWNSLLTIDSSAYAYSYAF